MSEIAYEPAVDAGEVEPDLAPETQETLGSLAEILPTAIDQAVDARLASLAEQQQAEWQVQQVEAERQAALDAWIDEDPSRADLVEVARALEARYEAEFGPIRGMVEQFQGQLAAQQVAQTLEQVFAAFEERSGGTVDRAAVIEAGEQRLGRITALAEAQGMDRDTIWSALQEGNFGLRIITEAAEEHLKPPHEGMERDERGRFVSRKPPANELEAAIQFRAKRAGAPVPASQVQHQRDVDRAVADATMTPGRPRSELSVAREFTRNRPQLTQDERLAAFREREAARARGEAEMRNAVRGA